MALTRDQIINSPAILDSVTRDMYVVLFRSNDYYRKNALIFSTDVATRLANANGTIKGRMLNALATKIDILGTGVVEIRADKDGVWWSQYKERNDLITEALRVLYDDSIEGVILEGQEYQGYVNTAAGLYGTAAVGQRSIPCDKCSQFMCNCGACN